MLQNNQILQNRYRITNVMGQGGMGAVYRAFDQRLNNYCIVKQMLISAESSSQVAGAAQQFQREAETLASLRHPNVPRVYDYFQEETHYYLVMDLIEGQSLQSLIGPNGLPEQVVLNYADQLLGVLEYIHGNGVLHRDIKPANIIVQSNGRAVLVDFGLVKVMTGAPGPTRTIVHGMGTPEYAPPEQYTGGTDQRSDIYSLAATLYQALTGQRPASATEQMSGIRPLIAPRQFNNQVSARTERIILTALNLNRDLRYQSAAAMRADLAKPEIVTQVMTQPRATAPAVVPVYQPPAGATGAPVTPVPVAAVKPARRGASPLLIVGLILLLACGGLCAVLYLAGKSTLDTATQTVQASMTRGITVTQQLTTLTVVGTPKKSVVTSTPRPAATRVQKPTTTVRATPDATGALRVGVDFSQYPNGGARLTQTRIITNIGTDNNPDFGGSMRFLGEGSTLGVSFPVSKVPGKATLLVTHLSSAADTCQNGGWSPVTITVNGNLVVVNYSPAAHGYINDNWDVTPDLQTGINLIVFSVHNLCTHYWLRSFTITGQSLSGR